MADATAIGSLNNLDRVFDHIGKGSALLHYTVEGHTSGGEPFTLVRTNRFASDFDITFESIFEPANNVYSLLNNEFTDVTIDEVRLETTCPPSRAPSGSPRCSTCTRARGGHSPPTRGSRPSRARDGLQITLASAKNKFGSKLIYSSVNVPSEHRAGHVRHAQHRCGFLRRVLLRGRVRRRRRPVRSRSRSFSTTLPTLRATTSSPRASTSTATKTDRARTPRRASSSPT